MVQKKDKYVKIRDLQAEVMTLIDGSGEQDYIKIEVLKLIISEIKARKKPEKYSG